MGNPSAECGPETVLLGDGSARKEPSPKDKCSRCFPVASVQGKGERRGLCKLYTVSVAFLGISYWPLSAAARS